MGIVFDIKRGGVKDGPGIRTSVFLKGCPLRCAWCHNPESQAPEIQRAATDGAVCGREMSVGDVMAEVRRDKVFYRTSGGGVTFTGGEPMMQFGFLRELCAAAKAEDIHVALDTSGWAPPAEFAEICPLVDLFLFDLKATGEDGHRLLTGVPSDPILANLRLLDGLGARIHLRCPLVPGVNDSEEHLRHIAELAETLKGVEEIRILPYHRLGEEKYARFGLTAPLKDVAEPSPGTVRVWMTALSFRTRVHVAV